MEPTPPDPLKSLHRRRAPLGARLCGAAQGGPFRAAGPACGKTLLSATRWREFTNTKNMKTKPTKIDRSGAKWLPGAMALAATASSTQAATVQITLTGNKISTVGNNLYGDLTGDLAPDVGFIDSRKLK